MTLPAKARAAFDRIAERHLCTTADVLGRSGVKHIADARRECCQWLRDMGWSYPSIGRALGRHHSTVQSVLKGRP